MDSRKFSFCSVFFFFLTTGIGVFTLPRGAQAAEWWPDLQAFPAYSLVVTTSTSGQKLLRFSTRTWNSGDGALELRAKTDVNGHVDQRIYNSAGGYQDYFAGTFTFHPEHNHFHFDDYALYTLQPVNAPGGSARTGSKMTFCIMDTNVINSSLPRAPQQAVYSTCGSTVQGMSVGWADTYGYQLAGQSIDITGLPSGDYALSIEADFKNRIRELNESNNTSCMLVRLNMSNSTVQVLNANTCNYQQRKKKGHGHQS